MLWQELDLAEGWGWKWTAQAGRQHFDVIEGLEDGSSGLMAACLG